MKTFKTIHTGRTMMFAELEKVMDYSIDGDSYLDSLGIKILIKNQRMESSSLGVFLNDFIASTPHILNSMLSNTAGRILNVVKSHCLH